MYVLLCVALSSSERCPPSPLSPSLSLQGGLFVTASALLSTSFKRVQGMRMTRGQNCKSTCYFALGVIVLVFVAYLLIDKVISR